ncbi:hypothetical protein ACVWYF_002761 [Hymenobacter sp. UYAg731]
MPAAFLRCFFWRVLPALFALWPALCAAQAQPEPITFGKIDPRDLTAAPFAADSAAAVILCDYGSASIATDVAATRKVRFTRTTRIKILTKAGLEWANGQLLLHHEQPGYTEQLTSLRGFTYNLVDGQVKQEPLAAAGIFTDDASETYAIKRFALPNVRVGSVIEFNYTIVSDYVVGFRSWPFQHSIPVRWSEFRATMFHQYAYKILLQNKQPLALDEGTGQKSLTPRFRWAMRDVPALSREPYMTATADYVDGLTFELDSFDGQAFLRTWAEVDRFVLKDPALGVQLDQFSFMKADLARLVPAPAPANALARVAAVRALVMAAVKCNGKTGNTTSAVLRKVYQETHQGTVAEVNLLLIAALRGAGFVANPVLLSTRSHGQIRPTIPLLGQFNYVAAHVLLADDQELVLDATDPLLPYDLLPERCLNQQGRLVLPAPGASRWVSLTPRQRHTHLQQVQGQLSATGAFSGQVHEEFGGYAGGTARAGLHEMGDRKFAARLADQHPGMTLGPLAIANRDSAQNPLALDYAFAQAAEATSPPDQLYVSPLHDFGLTQNPFKAEQRAFPVDFGYAREETLLMTLTLPPGYALADAPRPSALNLPNDGGRYVCSITAPAPGVVQLSSRLVLRKPIYAVAEYGQLRELYRLLLEKQAGKLLIQKKTGG